MRAVVQQGYGGTETWTVREVPEPVAGRGQVLVEVRAAAIDRGTWHLMTGEPLLMRPSSGSAGSGSRCPAATWPAWWSPSVPTSPASRSATRSTARPPPVRSPSAPSSR